MKIKGLNDEESPVLLLTLTLLSIGAIFKVLFLFHHASGWLDVVGAVFLGLGAGSTASVTTQRIQRSIRERKLREHFGKYAGLWNRECLFQYPYLSVQPKTGSVTMVGKLRDKDADGEAITITYAGGRTLNLMVKYDKGRGEVEGQVEFTSDKGIVGEGTYVYVGGPLKDASDNDGFSHSGRYAVHLFPDADPDVVRVYYDGLMPEPDARGYEVWRRGQ